MTAAAIGSGAAGGTLTPAVALGATLGAILGVPPVGGWGWMKNAGKTMEKPGKILGTSEKLMGKYRKIRRNFPDVMIFHGKINGKMSGKSMFCFGIFSRLNQAPLNPGDAMI